MPRRFSIEVAKDYFNFASAHFLIFANGRREHLHGHNYQVSVAMEGELDRAASCWTSSPSSRWSNKFAMLSIIGL